MNGRQVLRQVIATRLAELKEVGRLSLGRGTCSLYTSTGGGLRWMGWSANLQNSWGVSNAFKRDLGAWLAQVCSSHVKSPPLPSSVKTPLLIPSGYLPQGRRIAGKTELVNVLRRWLAESQAPTVGDVGTFGRLVWLRIEVNGHEIVLNADTKRTAIETFVRDSRSEPERPWRVVANRRGRFNKVLPGPSYDSLRGWYAYLIHALTKEGVI